MVHKWPEINSLDSLKNCPQSPKNVDGRPLKTTAYRLGKGNFWRVGGFVFRVVLKISKGNRLKFENRLGSERSYHRLP